MNKNTNVRCYIGIGSNLNQPLQQLNDAREKIKSLSEITLLQCSSIYQSVAFTLDDEPQNDYLNAVFEIDTTLDAESLLDTLQQLELEQGRTREKRWAARTIDLDILLYGNQIINSPRLSVPHIEMDKRSFVLLPLAQIAKDIIIPGKEKLNILLEKIADQALKKVSEFNE